MKDAIFFIVMIGFFLIPAAVVGQWYLFSVFVVFFIAFGLVEWIATKWTGSTVSQLFWKYSKEHKVGAWVVLGGMLIAWLALLLHLGGSL